MKDIFLTVFAIGLCILEFSLSTLGQHRMFVGKKAAPYFLGRRASPFFIGRRASPMFVGKKASPMFIGKKATPMFVGKKATPMFVGKKATPMFLGKKATPMFVGRRSEQEENYLRNKMAHLFIGRRAAPYFLGKRGGTPMFVGKKSFLESDELLENQMCMLTDDCPPEHCCISTGANYLSTCIPQGGLGEKCLPESTPQEIIEELTSLESEDDQDVRTLAQQLLCSCRDGLVCQSEQDKNLGVCTYAALKETLNLVGSDDE